MKSRIEKKLKIIAKEYGISVRFMPHDPYIGGGYLGDKKSIVVMRDRSKKDWIVMAFFHELCHVLDHRDGLYANYYKAGQSMRKRGILALRAERHVDNRAKKLCKEYFPKVKYTCGYDTPEKVQF